MSVFKLPMTLCDDLQAMVAMFWWGGGSETRKIHRFRWDKLCRPKSKGGMVFRDVASFKQALLAKQGWRLI